MKVISKKYKEQKNMLEKSEKIINDLVQNNFKWFWPIITELQISYDRSESVKTRQNKPFILKEWKIVLIEEEADNFKGIKTKLIKKLNKKEIEKYFENKWNTQKIIETKNILPYFSFSFIKNIKQTLLYMINNDIDRITIYTEWFENKLETFTIKDLQTIKKEIVKK